MQSGFDADMGCHLSASEPEVVAARRALAPTTCAWLLIADTRHDYLRQTPCVAAQTLHDPGLARHAPPLQLLTSTMTLRSLPCGTRRPAPHSPQAPAADTKRWLARSGFLLPLAPRAVRRGAEGGEVGGRGSSGYCGQPPAACHVPVRREFSRAWGAGGVRGGQSSFRAMGSVDGPCGELLPQWLDWKIPRAG